MDIDKLLQFGKDYGNLGSSVQEQFHKLLERDFNDINPNAVKLMRKLRRYHEDIAEALDEYERRED